MILVFDLDETLYDERCFVRGGLRAVADRLQREYAVPTGHSLDFMQQRVAERRDGVLDETLRELKLHSRAELARCIAVYREHTPDIRLAPASTRCLRRFARQPRYLVTDGNRRVQRRKIRALKLEPLLTGIFVTHEYGLRAAKPSPHCFELICAKEGVAPRSVVYVADDPNKDFVGLKPLGFKTVRLRRGRFRDLRLDRAHEAHCEITSLDELTPELLNSFADRRRFPGLTGHPQRRGRTPLKSARG